MTYITERQGQPFDVLLAIVRRLRDPDGGCPWDLEQTHTSLRNTLLEETYEALEALDSTDLASIVEELGDVLFQVVFHAQIGADNQEFTMEEVVEGLTNKLVRRHPHVFGSTVARNAGEVVGQWERLKAAERAAKGTGERSMLDGVPKSMPALAYAQAVTERAARTGFDFELNPVTLADLEGEVLKPGKLAAADQQEKEFGDQLFRVVISASRAGIDAEAALRASSQRFRERFGLMEVAVRESGSTLETLDAGAVKYFWDQTEVSLD